MVHLHLITVWQSCAKRHRFISAANWRCERRPFSDCAGRRRRPPRARPSGWLLAAAAGCGSSPARRSVRPGADGRLRRRVTRALKHQPGRAAAPQSKQTPPPTHGGGATPSQPHGTVSTVRPTGQQCEPAARGFYLSNNSAISCHRLCWRSDRQCFSERAWEHDGKLLVLLRYVGLRNVGQCCATLQRKTVKILGEDQQCIP